jgi:WD40 repeat protein
LVIEFDDANVEVKVTQGGNQVEVLDRETGDSVTLKAGQYEVSLASDRNDVRLEQNSVTLTRGGKQVVRIVREESVASASAEPKAAAAPSSQPAAPAASALSDESQVGFIRRFLGHTDYIGYVVFSSDGTKALSASWDKTARLWNVATGDEIRRFADHTGGVTAAALSADGRYALTGQGDWYENGIRKKGDDYDLRLWDIDTGKLLRRMEGHRDIVCMVCISGDSRRAVSAGLDQTIRQWDLETGREKHRFDCHAPVLGLALSQDNRRVLAACMDGAVLLVDIESEREIRRYARQSARVPYVAFSPDESRFVSASDDGEPRIWNTQTGEFLKLPKHRARSLSAVFTPDGQSVLTSCNDEVVRMWEAATGKLVHRFEGHTRAATGLAVSPDGRFALSASNDTTIRLWGLPTSPQLKPPAQFGPTPLDEWLQGRKIITVSQNGKGDHKTIEDALKALQPGQVVELLDRGPYRETIVLTLPEDVGLISRAGARVELAHWRQSPGEEDPQKHRYWGWFLTAPRGLRISGLEFAGPKLPADTENATLFNVRAAGDMIVDQCRFLHNPRYGVTPDFEDPELKVFFGLSLESYLEAPHWPCRVHYDRNLVEGVSFCRLEYPAPIIVERCRLLGRRWNALTLDGNAGAVAFRHNVVHGYAGLTLYAQHPHTSYVIVNNLFDVAADPFSFWTGDKLQPAPPRQVRLENNVVHSSGSEGFNVLADHAATIAADWRVGNNCYEAAPLPVRDVAPVPLQPSDVIHSSPFAAVDTSDEDYLTPANDGPLANGGAGGDLPDYIGPLAPSADAPENAWFAELNREWKHDLGPRLKPDDVAAPLPLDQWLQGRTLRTVAQDGSGEFKTIGEALAAVKPGEAVQVLDKGPYRETFNLTLPANTGLVSEVNTQIEFSQWQPWAAFTAGKSNYFGARLFVTDGFRLSGFQFTGPKLPDDTEWAWVIELGRVRGDVTVEDCILLHTFPRYSFTPGTEEVYPHLFRGLHVDKHFTPRDAPTKICLRDCWIEGMVDFVGECRASILMERNCVIGWRPDTLYLPHQAEDVVIRNNVLAGGYGIGIRERNGHPRGARPESRYAIVNNTVYSIWHPIAALWLAPGRLNDLASPAKNVRIENNLIWSRESNGIHLHPADLPAVKDAWQVGHNAYLADPQPWRDSPTFPRQASDVIVPKPFVSDDQASADFLRIADDSPLATDGAGGDLPAYIGAFPPGPAAKDDWFARLRARIAEFRGVERED